MQSDAVSKSSLPHGPAARRFEGKGLRGIVPRHESFQGRTFEVYRIDASFGIPNYSATIFILINGIPDADWRNPPYNINDLVTNSGMLVRTNLQNIEIVRTVPLRKPFSDEIWVSFVKINSADERPSPSLEFRHY